MLDSITPVLLTYNEGPNIGRTLAKLVWAKDIVIVDSGSTDDTLRIVGTNPRVRVFQRAFDTHHAQWRYAMQETGIRTPWVLRLDADYQISDGLTAEMAALDQARPESAYCVDFDYAIFSRKLISSLYPPKPILLRQGRYAISDEGHTEGWVVNGAVTRLKSRIIHDDWKLMRDWVIAQARYMSREREKLESKKTGLRDWLRMHPPLMPLIVFFYCLFFRGLLFNGKSGLLYTLQRTIAEAILALYVLEKQLAPETSKTEASDGRSGLSLSGGRHERTVTRASSRSTPE
jgi:glycosyltransferase involved in cell wall biosynthesis